MAKAKSPPTGKIGMLVSVLLDESGSMGHCRMQTLKSFNAYVEALTLSARPANVSASTFGCSWSRKILDRRPSYELPKLTAEQYRPSGGTPLCRTMGEEMKVMDGIDAEQKAMVVLTDGQDFGGAHWNCARIAKMIAERMAKGWLFILVGADPGAFSFGPILGFREDQMISCDPHNIEKAMQIVAVATLRYQNSDGTEPVFSREERMEAMGMDERRYADFEAQAKKGADGYVKFVKENFGSFDVSGED